MTLPKSWDLSRKKKKKVGEEILTILAFAVSFFTVLPIPFSSDQIFPWSSFCWCQSYQSPSCCLHIPCDFQFQLSFNSISVSWRNVTTFMLGTCPVPICFFSLRLCLNSVRSLQISQADLLLSLPDFLHIVMGFMLWSGCPSISTYLSTCQRLLAFWDCHWQDIAYFFPEWAKIF